MRRALTGPGTFVKPLPELQDLLDTLRLGHQPSAMKDVHVNLDAAGLVTAKKIAGQPDPHNRQAQAARDQQIKQAQVDRIADAAVEQDIEINVLRVAKVLVIAGEAQFVKKVIVDDAQNLLGRRAQIQPLAQLAGKIVEQRDIGLGIDRGILRAGQEKDASFQVGIFALIEAKGQKLRIRVLAGEIIDNLAGAAAQDGIIAQGMLAHPMGRSRPVGENRFANGLVNPRVVVGQQAD